MNKFLILIAAMHSSFALAAIPTTVNVRFPQHTLPAINVQITRLMPDSETRIFEGRMDIQVLCENGEIHLTRVSKNGKPIIARICNYSQTLWDPVNDRIRVDIGIENQGKCMPDTLIFNRAELIHNYCNLRSSGSAP